MVSMPLRERERLDINFEFRIIIADLFIPLEKMGTKENPNNDGKKECNVPQEVGYKRY